MRGGRIARAHRSHHPVVVVSALAVNHRVRISRNFAPEQAFPVAHRIGLGRAGEPGWLTVNEVRRIEREADEAIAAIIKEATK